jgi:hypothetical protein
LGIDGPPRFTDAQNGLLTAEFGGAGQGSDAGSVSALVMYRTSDGGATWQAGQPLVDPMLSNYGAGAAPSWVVGGPHVPALAVTIIGQHVWTTSDGGISWAEPDAALPRTLWFKPAAVGSDGVIFIAGSYETCPGKQPPCSTASAMMTSPDGGSSWTPRPVPRG